MRAYGAEASDCQWRIGAAPDLAREAAAEEDIVCGVIAVLTEAKADAQALSDVRRIWPPKKRTKRAKSATDYAVFATDLEVG